MAEGSGQIGLKIQEGLQAHQLHGLHDTAISDNQETSLALIPLLGQLHERTEARRIDEINLAQINHQRSQPCRCVEADEIPELTLGIGIQLPREMEQEALILGLKTSPERNSESL